MPSTGIIADRRKQLEEEIEDLMNRDEDGDNKEKNGEDDSAHNTSREEDASYTKDTVNRLDLYNPT